MNAMNMRTVVALGLSSVRGNLVPMVALWGAAVVVAVSYYHCDLFAAVLEPIADFQVAGGYFAAFLNRLVFCGVIPGFFILLLPRLRPKHRAVTVVALTSIWCGLWGIVCDGFYRMQQDWFGTGTGVWTILLKTCVDQFVFNVFVITPTSAAFYFWTANGLDFALMRRRWPKDWLSSIILTNLIAGWCVHVPVIAVVYSFPQPLQVQLSGFVASFWTLVSLGIGRRCVVAKMLQ